MIWVEGVAFVHPVEKFEDSNESKQKKEIDSIIKVANEWFEVVFVVTDGFMDVKTVDDEGIIGKQNKK